MVMEEGIRSGKEVKRIRIQRVRVLIVAAMSRSATLKNGIRWTICRHSLDISENIITHHHSLIQ